MRSETQRGSAGSAIHMFRTSIDRYAAARGKVFLMRWGAPSDVPKSAFCCESVSLWERVTYFEPDMVDNLRAAARGPPARGTGARAAPPPGPAAARRRRRGANCN